MPLPYHHRAARAACHLPPFLLWFGSDEWIGGVVVITFCTRALSVGRRWISSLRARSGRMDGRMDEYVVQMSISIILFTHHPTPPCRFLRPATTFPIATPHLRASPAALHARTAPPFCTHALRAHARAPYSNENHALSDNHRARRATGARALRAQAGMLHTHTTPVRVPGLSPYGRQ